jgi:hypothetical protein
MQVAKRKKPLALVPKKKEKFKAVLLGDKRFLLE